MLPLSRYFLPWVAESCAILVLTSYSLLARQGVFECLIHIGFALTRNFLSHINGKTKCCFLYRYVEQAVGVHKLYSAKMKMLT
jgi:hypothetical protein